MADTEADISKTLSQMVDMMKKVNERLGTIETQIQKLGSVQASLACKVDKLDKDAKDIRKKNTDIEVSTEAISEFYESVKTKVGQNEKEIERVRSEADDLKESTRDHCDSRAKVENELLMLRKECNDLNCVTEDLQCRSMKNNLIFTGLQEQKYENTEEKLKDFIRWELGIERDIPFGNVHRFQRYVRGKTRPIVARFLFNNDRQMVKKSGYMLKGTHFGIREQFPDAVEERRKKLYRVMKHHKANGHSVQMVRDRLYIDGEPYFPGDELYQQPEQSDQVTYSQALQHGANTETPRGEKRGRTSSTPNGDSSERPQARARTSSPLVQSPMFTRDRDLPSARQSPAGYERVRSPRLPAEDFTASQRHSPRTPDGHVSGQRPTIPPNGSRHDHNGRFDRGFGNRRGR